MTSSPSSKSPTTGTTDPAARASTRTRTIPTSFVLAASSTMIMIGVVAVFLRPRAEPSPTIRPGNAGSTLHLDDETPEAAAESYLDAWRRRAWDGCASLSEGAARQAALHKKQLDAELPETDRAMAREVWERLASAPLHVAFAESEDLGSGRVRLRGTAESELMGAPSRRDVEWVIVPSADGFRVAEMEHGAVLTDLPALLEGAER